MLRRPIFVAIVGGSGAGKSWLAEKLQEALGSKAARLSLDDFYRDRSGLSPARRAKINFDNPAGIDWQSLEKVLVSLSNWQVARKPCYDFKTHCRLRGSVTLKPRPVILVDGLWLLRRPFIRQFFNLTLF